MYYLGSVVDRQMNYGRHLIKDFLMYSYPFKNVLDIGAGKGDDLQIAREVSRKGIVYLYAIELYKPNILSLKEQGITVFPLDIERDIFPFEKEYIDIVIANQILEHTKEIFWIFHQISRILKVGGKIIIGVPNLAAIHNRLLLLFGYQPTCLKNNSAHIRGYTKHDILRLVHCVFPEGFHLKKFSGSNIYPFPKRVALFLSSIFPNFSTGIFCFLRN